MDNNALTELIWPIAIMIWPICVLIIVILFRKEIRQKINSDKNACIHKKNPKCAEIIHINKTNDLITTEPTENFYTLVQIRKNINSGQHFIILYECNHSKEVMILPNGEQKALETRFFYEIEEIELDFLLKNNLITIEQHTSYNKYMEIYDDVTTDYPSSKEPLYIQKYRAMLNGENTLPSRMLAFIKISKSSTWADVKNFLAMRYGYRESGSLSASLKVLHIDGYIKINGHGDGKVISLTSYQ